ncbi:hypothetical protein [Nitrospira moscoviensis]|uniref:Fibronectin type-III domain-containing protein n=1 Tax=Nitrospira moscoviensis TaxID=42253 RepID=A0A0K2G841_NITMO|nr:hypothetical protein [Nitrospira moscoviensis]ALA57100.1 exported protein of unknown function [Nitrospira moscoviensis]
MNRNWMKVAALAVLVGPGTVWGATLQWDANREMDLAGYRVYRCSQQPCGRAYGTASVLATLGNVTSFDIGTPSTTQYYVITAFDTANNESSESNVASYVPAGSPPSPPPPPLSSPPSPPPLAPPPIPTGLRFTRGN